LILGTFKFKHFSLQQSHAALKVGTDAMILGAFASFEGKRNLLDIGTGTGVLALMQAQKNPELDIHAIEIDSEACKDAEANFNHSTFPNAFQLFQGDFLNFKSKNKFDAFICNPPFYENALKGENTSLNKAKHVVEMNLKKLIAKINEVAEEEALFWLIWPNGGQDEMHKVFNQQGWNCQKEILVNGKPGKAIRTISTWTNQNTSSEPKKTEFLIRDDRGEYSAEYKKLTLEFHDRPI
jgi:tRNA1Val (adenine37-N6)-methyltransferase